MEIDTLNKWGVATRGNGELTILMPHRATNMKPADALVLAAWLVLMAEPGSGLVFGDVYKKVRDESA